MASNNKMLGEFELVGIPPVPRGLPQIEVTFDIDAKDIVTISAKDKATGKEQQITIRSSGGLSDDEIEKMVKEAELHAQRDQERKALIDIRNQADTIIYSIEKSLGEYREKIPSEVAKEIEDAVADLRKAMGTDNIDDIKAKLDSANKAVSKIGQHVSGGGTVASGGLSNDEIEKMVEKAELHAQRDQERKALIDIRNQADTTIYSIEKSLGEYREKEAKLHAQRNQERKALIDIRNQADITIYGIEKSLGEYREKIPNEVSKEIEDVVADLRKAMGADNIDDIKAKLDAANKAISNIGQHMSGGGAVTFGGSDGGGEQTPES